MKNFQKEAIKQLKYYVYRLVDPRNGLTFYVGKGKNNRIFDHVHFSQKSSIRKLLSKGEEKENLKLDTINAIHQAGLEIMYIIHRYGMDNATAYQVEGALIDAYAGLTNKVNGHYNNDYGVISAIELDKLFTVKEFKDTNEFGPYMIIKVRQSTIDNISGSLEEKLYEATRGNWSVNINNVNKRKFALSVVDGMVKEVYQLNSWSPSMREEGRYLFDGEIAKEIIRNYFINKRIPSKYRKKGAASPFLYSK